jgi:hypothetical protein
MSDLAYPFSKCDEPPYYQVAMGTGEYVWVVLAGDYRYLEAAAKKWREIAISLHADLHPNQTREEAAGEVMRWHPVIP